MDQENIRQIVLLDSDYTTESHNLGKRTYKADGYYQVCDAMLAELLATGRTIRVAPGTFRGRLAVINREQVTVVPNVTRWFTANGQDTHYLTAGEPKAVPSNLAVYLTLNGFAQAA
jgi:hypothetical protein